MGRTYRRGRAWFLLPRSGAPLCQGNLPRPRRYSQTPMAIPSRPARHAVVPPMARLAIPLFELVGLSPLDVGAGCSVIVAIDCQGGVGDGGTEFSDLELANVEEAPPRDWELLMLLPPGNEY